MFDGVQGSGYIDLGVSLVAQVHAIYSNDKKQRGKPLKMEEARIFKYSRVVRHGFRNMLVLGGKEIKY